MRGQRESCRQGRQNRRQQWLNLERTEKTHTHARALSCTRIHELALGLGEREAAILVLQFVFRARGQVAARANCGFILKPLHTR
eukprot:1775567-Pleurochrysis_carterae.AAC.1